MSAYLVSDTLISALVSAAATYGTLQEPAELAAERLKLENARSLIARYGSWEGCEEPCEYKQRVNYLHPVSVLAAIDCYTYQACEHEGWTESSAAEFCAALTEKIIRVEKIDASLRAGGYGQQPRPAYKTLPEYTSSAANTDEAPPVVVPSLQEFFALSTEEQARTLETLPIEEREILIVEVARLTTSPKMGKISVVLSGRACDLSVAEEFSRAEITPGESITLWGRRMVHPSAKRNAQGTYAARPSVLMPYCRTFKIGDVVEESSYNLVYTGPITAIGPKTVMVQCHGTKRMKLERFNSLNWDLDLKAISERNANWMD